MPYLYGLLYVPRGDISALFTFIVHVSLCNKKCIFIQKLTLQYYHCRITNHIKPFCYILICRNKMLLSNKVIFRRSPMYEIISRHKVLLLPLIKKVKIFLQQFLIFAIFVMVGNVTQGYHLSLMSCSHNRIHLLLVFLTSLEHCCNSIVS